MFSVATVRLTTWDIERWAYFEDRFPRLDSSKIHSWPPAMQRLHGGPCSAPTHFILSLLQTVHALGDGSQQGKIGGRGSK